MSPDRKPITEPHFRRAAGPWAPRRKIVPSQSRGASARGYTVLEVIFASALAVTASGVAVPQLMAAIDDTRTAGAARYFATRVQQARMEALTRSVEVAVQFSSGASGYTYGC